MLRFGLVALALLSSAAFAQTPDSLGGRGLLLGAGGVGLGLGDVPRVTGLRINVRDRALQRVAGLHVTALAPRAPADSASHVTGLALGLPVTGGGRVEGVAAGLLGVGRRSR